MHDIRKNDNSQKTQLNPTQQTIQRNKLTTI